MEVIQDELKKNNVRIDIETLTEHIEYILNNYRDSYNQSIDRLTREELLLDVFHEMNVNSLGRAMAYLTQRRYGTSSCPFSCTCNKKHRKSRRGFYT